MSIEKSNIRRGARPHEGLESIKGLASSYPLEPLPCTNPNVREAFDAYDALNPVTNKSKAAKELAKKACQSCVIQEECLGHAVKNDEKFSIWGGKTKKGRDDMGRRSRRSIRRRR